MQSTNLSAFFAGAATMYFLMQAATTLSIKKPTRYQTVLGWIFVVWTVFNLKDIVITFPEFYTEQVQNYILIIDGWSAITYTIFIFEITMPGWTNWRRIGLLCVPWLIFTLLYIIVPCDTVLHAYIAFLWCYAWTIVIIAFFKTRRYLRYIHNNYSNIDKIDISWLRYVFWFCIISQLAWLATSLMYNTYTDALYYGSTIVMWQMIIHYSYHLKTVTMEQQQDICTTTTLQQSEPAREYPFAGELERIVEEEMLYLKPDLSLEDLTNRVLTNRTYLSDYFNNVKHTSFYNYINSLRIHKKSVPLMQQHPEYTLEYIAAESGFLSISTFRRAFRKLTGKSPGQYRSEL